MARECKELWPFISTAYYDTLSHAHANFGGIIQRLTADEDGFSFLDTSPPEEVDFVLGNAHSLLLLVLHQQVLHFNLTEIQAELDGCSEDCIKAWD